MNQSPAAKAIIKKEKPDFRSVKLAVTDILFLEENDLPNIKAEDFEDPVEPSRMIENCWLSGSPKSTFFSTSFSHRLNNEWEDTLDFAAHVDPIEKEIVANVDTVKLYNHAPPFAKHAISFTLENSGADLEPRDPLEFKRRFDTRGVPSIQLHPSVYALMRLIQEGDMNKVKCPLYDTRRSAYLKLSELGPHLQNYMQLRKDAGFCHVGVFTVDKSSKHQDGKFLQRIILDARWANAYYKNAVPIQLFSLEALVSLVTALFKLEKDLFVISADLRHWFHQLPMPIRLAIHYYINLHKPGTEFTLLDVLFSKAWPMGASPAPGIGQNCTWALLLNELENDLVSRKAFGILHEGSFDTQLTWLPLAGGGGIFVLIDNILVITADEEVAKKWEARLNNFESKYRAQLKSPAKIQSLRYEAPLGVDAPTKQHQQQQQQQQSEEFFEFAGIEFSRSGRRPRNPVNAVPCLDDPDSKRWESSYRNLASVIGQCLWAYRVRGFKLIDPEMEPYQKIASKCYPRGPKQDWDISAPLIGDDFECLRTLYQTVAKDRSFTPYPNIIKQMSKVCYVATDASLEAGVAGLGAVWSFDGMPGFESRAWKHKMLGAQIALEELRAVALTLEAILATPEGKETDVFMLGIDSVHARSMIEKGAAHSALGKHLLRSIYKLLDGRRLVMSYVESAWNPADNPSRGEQVHPDCWNVLKKRFQSVKQAAMVDLAVCGKAVVKSSLIGKMSED